MLLKPNHAESTTAIRARFIHCRHGTGRKLSNEPFHPGLRAGISSGGLLFSTQRRRAVYY
jgi:hypothetical protein